MNNDMPMLLAIFGKEAGWQTSEISKCFKESTIFTASLDL